VERPVEIEEGWHVLIVQEIITKRGSEWCLMSKKKDSKGKRKNLGCYSSKEKAKEREGQVQFFKHQALDRAIDMLIEGHATPDEVISGALFDFAGYLTCQDEVMPVGASADAAPMADALKEWAGTRGLELEDAAVEDWEDIKSELGLVDEAYDPVTVRELIQRVKSARGPIYASCMAHDAVVHVQIVKADLLHNLRRRNLDDIAPFAMEQGAGGEWYIDSPVFCPSNLD